MKTFDGDDEEIMERAYSAMAEQAGRTYSAMTSEIAARELCHVIGMDYVSHSLDDGVLIVRGNLRVPIHAIGITGTVDTGAEEADNEKVPT